MALQQESVFGQESVGVQGDSAVRQHTTLTPKMVLSWLPKVPHLPSRTLPSKRISNHRKSVGAVAPTRSTCQVTTRDTICWTLTCRNIIVRGFSRKIPCFIQNCLADDMVWQAILFLIRSNTTTSSSRCYCYCLCWQR